MKFKTQVKFKSIFTLKMKMKLNIETNCLFRKKFGFVCKITGDTDGPPYSTSALVVDSQRIAKAIGFDDDNSFIYFRTVAHSSVLIYNGPSIYHKIAKNLIHLQVVNLKI